MNRRMVLYHELFFYMIFLFFLINNRKDRKDILSWNRIIWLEWNSLYFDYELFIVEMKYLPIIYLFWSCCCVYLIWLRFSTVVQGQSSLTAFIVSTKGLTYPYIPPLDLLTIESPIHVPYIRTVMTIYTFCIVPCS